MKRLMLGVGALIAAVLIVLIAMFMRVEPLEEAEQTAKVTQMNDIVILETSEGTIEIELYKDKAPVTVQNFETYVNEGHYSGTVFHRVIPGFMIQGGGFTSDGNQKPTHDPISLESQNGLKNTRGTIAMARTMIPNSATSQFFINTVDNSMLDYRPGNDGYAVFGKVTKGMDVVDAISKVATASKGPHDDWPVEDITIESARLK